MFIAKSTGGANAGQLCAQSVLYNEDTLRMDLWKKYIHVGCSVFTMCTYRRHDRYIMYGL